ncbi:S-layer homology domain-containing protein, partial [Patescibacteria group bacterium]|nr:S-layer homology domain-containing protein [Patescibacteria group bacterium]MBU1703653.1 S-layer homology domain-containing protein [Patescibacteria group bacterium]MBU1953988.1 S-layer homology domain-containing protein [Patescibacteria group bacterium]
SLSRFSNLGAVMRLRLFVHQQEIIQELKDIYDYLKDLMENDTLTDEQAKKIMNLLDKLIRMSFTDNLKDLAKAKIAKLKERINNAALTTDDLEEALTSLDEEMASGDLEGKFKAGITPFCDFDDSAWFSEDVDYLKRAGIVAGDTGKCTFRPGDSVSRAEILKMAIEAAGDSGLLEQEEDPAFQDSREHWAKKYIAFALKRNHVSGFEDGFHPNQAVTRAEAVKIIFNVMGIKPTKDDLAAAFPDMEGHWGAAIVAYAKDLGIVGGDPDGNFRPDAPVNRAEASKIIRATIEYVQGVSDTVSDESADEATDETADVTEEETI